MTLWTVTQAGLFLLMVLATPLAQTVPPPEVAHVPTPAEIQQLAAIRDQVEDSEFQRLLILVTAIMSFMATVLGYIYTGWRETRNRRWDREDAERRAKEIKDEAVATAEALAMKTELARLDLADKVERTRLDLETEHLLASAKRDDLSRQLAENTDISRNAFTEANNVNQKIALLTEAYDAVAGRTARIEQQQDAAVIAVKANTDEIRATGDDTNARVRGTEGEVNS
jgi:hypothetical protein